MLICIIGGSMARAALFKSEADIVVVTANADGTYDFKDEAADAPETQIEPRITDIPLERYKVRVVKAYNAPPPVPQTDTDKLKLVALPPASEQPWERDRGDCIRSLRTTGAQRVHRKRYLISRRRT